MAVPIFRARVCARVCWVFARECIDPVSKDTYQWNARRARTSACESMTMFPVESISSVPRHLLPVPRATALNLRARPPPMRANMKNKKIQPHSHITSQPFLFFFWVSLRKQTQPGGCSPFHPVFSAQVQKARSIRCLLLAFLALATSGMLEERSGQRSRLHSLPSLPPPETFLFWNEEY